MTVSTLFSSVSENQNQAGPFVPANTVVDTGVNGVTHAIFTLTVTPVTAWARATIGVSADNANFLPLGSIEESPTGTGTQTQGLHPPPNTQRYFNALAMTVSPGATATLTMAY